MLRYFWNFLPLRQTIWLLWRNPLWSLLTWCGLSSNPQLFGTSFYRTASISSTSVYWLVEAQVSLYRIQLDSTLWMKKKKYSMLRSNFNATPTISLLLFSGSFSAPSSCHSFSLIQWITLVTSGIGWMPFQSPWMQSSWLYALLASSPEVMKLSAWKLWDRTEPSRASLCGSKCSTGWDYSLLLLTLWSWSCKRSLILSHSWLWSPSSSLRLVTTFMSSKTTWI